MGYRSNGRWVITGSLETVRAAWAGIKLSMLPFPHKHYDPWEYFDVFRCGDTGYIRFSFEGWKWYENHPEVKWFERVWRELSEVEGLSGRRVHIGEDNLADEQDFGEEPTPELSVSCTFYDGDPKSGEPLHTEPTNQ